MNQLYHRINQLLAISGQTWFKMQFIIFNPGEWLFLSVVIKLIMWVIKTMKEMKLIP